MKFKYEKKELAQKFILMLLVDLTFFCIGFLNIYMDSFFKNIFVLIPLCLLLILAFRTTFKIAERYAHGLEAINIIENVLSKLPTDYIYVDDICVSKKGNIDIVVAGPTGVWAVEVKSHRGNIIYDHQQHILRRKSGNLEKDFITQANGESFFLSSFLRNSLNMDISVKSILVFSNKNSYMKFGFKPVDNVYVIRKDWLLELLTQHSHQYLSQESVRKVKTTLATLPC